MLESIRNDSHLETVVCRIAHRQTYTIDRYRTFIDGEVPAFDHLAVGFVLEPIVIAAVRFLYGATHSRLVNVSLDYMSVETPVHYHRAFEVYAAAFSEQTEIAAVEGFAYRSNGILIARYIDYRQADAVVCNALVYFQLVGKRTLQCYM